MGKSQSVKKPTIRDVALHANVSTATVSRALSHSSYPISDELRERVMRSAETLGYAPNAAAQMLRKQTSQEIGLIIPSISNPFYLQAINGIDSVISSSGQILVLLNTQHDVQREREFLAILESRNALGAIVSSVDTSPQTINQFVKRGLKIVLLDQLLNGANCPMISTDMRSNGRLAVRHLLDLGHRDIAFATTPLSRWTRKEIYSGYCETLENEGILPDQNLLFIGEANDRYYPNDVELSAGAMAAELFIKQQCKATAIVCINDMVAFGVISTLKYHGLRVPEDISVIAFDDIPLAGAYCPPLTTIRYPAEQMGRLAAMMLTDSISNNTGLDALGIQLLPELRIRQSTKVAVSKPLNTGGKETASSFVNKPRTQSPEIRF